MRSILIEHSPCLLTVGDRDEIAQLFEPSIEAAVASIRAQIEASQGVVRVGACFRPAHS